MDTNKLNQYMDFTFLAKNSSNDELPDFRISCRIVGTFPGQSSCADPLSLSMLEIADISDILL